MNIYQIPLMLLHDYEPKKVKYPCWIQPKLDGILAQYIVETGQFISRDRIVFSDKVVGHCRELIQKSLTSIPKDIILVGEFYKHGWDVGRINGAITPIRTYATADSFEVSFNVFDWTSLDPEKHGNFNMRLNVMVNNNIPNRVPTMECKNQEDGDDYFNYYTERQGYEGIIYIMGDCEYINGRSHYKLKRKKLCKDQVECIGIKHGLGKYLKTTGSLICATLDGKVFNVASGLTDKQRNEFWQYPPIGSLIEIEYQCLSAKEKIPMKPVFIRVIK